jgi:glutaredoxin
MGDHKKMKKIVIVGLILALAVLPIGGATIPSQSIISLQPQPPAAAENFTHAVFTEYVTTTTCPYCVTASAQLYAISESHDYDFHYVTLVADQNKKIWSRVQDLGTTGVPDVHFDGGYRTLVGAQDDEQPYRNAIISSGERDVPDIDIDVTVAFKGKGTLDIAITVVNNEPETYNGHLRLYIVEPESRWNDLQNNPYHYGALDIPIDRALSIHEQSIQPLGDTYEISRTWHGALWGYGDITEDNIMVIAALFDPDTGYVVESAAATPSATTPTLFAHFPLLQELLAQLHARVL